MAEKQKPITPPYATYGSFTNFINKLRDTSVPSRIDASVFGNASGSVAYSTIAALKYLKLIDDEGTPSSAFVDLVKASDEDRVQILQKVIKNGYPSLFSGSLDLEKATAGQFDEHIRKEFDVSGSTVDKIAAFFLSAAKHAQITLSHHLLARKPIASSSGPRRSTRSKKRDSTENAELPNSASSPAELITEKALEYRLVDLMSEAADDPDVMGAIITVITFLKTKQIEERDTATN